MQPAPPDHYAVLGLDRRCTLAQIRAAYRLLSKKHHPDLNPDSPEAVARTQELNHAHSVLSDADQRRAYDRELASADEAAAPVRTGKIERNASQDVHLRIEEFIRGTTLEVRVNDPGNPNGSEIYELIIPPETAPGARFRVPRGEPFVGGFVQVRVKARPGGRFKVRGSDLRCDLRINARRAAQGGSEMMSGPMGQPLRVTIPANVARGEVLKIAGQGLPTARGGRGDILVRVTYRPEVRITRALGR